MKPRALVLIVLLLPSGGIAQEAFTRNSPCVTETVFPIADASRWKRIKTMEHFSPGSPLGLTVWPRTLGKETSIPEWYALGKYTCDGVSLREEVKKQGAEWEEPGLRISELRHLPNGNLEVTLEATLFNPVGNSDRLVTLSYEVLDPDGQQVQAASRSYKLAAKAKSGENADVVLLLTPDETRRVTNLRITITTKKF